MSSILLGILNAQAAGAVGEAYDLLQQESLGASTSSITFSSLGDYATDYKHLEMRWSAGRGIDDRGALLIDFNGDSTASNYYHHSQRALGGTPSVGSGNSNFFSAYGGNGTNVTTGVTQFINAFDTNSKTIARTFSGKANSTEPFINFVSTVWDNTASLTSITIKGSGTNLTASSLFSLYGIKRAA